MVKCLFGSSAVGLHFAQVTWSNSVIITAVVTHDVARVAAVKPWRAVRSLSEVTAMQGMLSVPSLLTLPSFMSLERL